MWDVILKILENVEIWHPLLLLLAPAAWKLIKELGINLAQKTETKWDDRAVATFNYVTERAVRSTYQTFVSAIKAASEDGTLTDEEARQALYKATVQIRSDFGWEEIQEVLRILSGTNEVNEVQAASMLHAEIEKTINIVKKSSPAVEYKDPFPSKPVAV